MNYQSGYNTLGDNAFSGVLVAFGVPVFAGVPFLGVPLNADPGGNSKRNERSIMVMTSLCPMSVASVTTSPFSKVGFTVLRLLTNT